MLLVVDVGNTNALFGVYDLALDNRVAAVRTATQQDRMPDEWFAMLTPSLQAQGVAVHDITAAVISSVVPSVTRWLELLCRERLGVEPILIHAGLDLGMPIDTDYPDEVGADRIVNALMARERYGTPVVCIDFGTALNFDVVNACGHYLGGALAPGLVVALEAMTARAAKLFAVDLVAPAAAIGRNTVTAIQSGLVLGYTSLMEGMIDRFTRELGTRPTTVLTGGYAELFAGLSDRIDAIDPNLTIDGLRLAYQILTSRKTA